MSTPKKRWPLTPRGYAIIALLVVIAVTTAAFVLHAISSRYPEADPNEAALRQKSTVTPAVDEGGSTGDPTTSTGNDQSGTNDGEGEASNGSGTSNDGRTSGVSGGGGTGPSGSSSGATNPYYSSGDSPKTSTSGSSGGANYTPNYNGGGNATTSSGNNGSNGGSGNGSSGTSNNNSGNGSDAGGSGGGSSDNSNGGSGSNDQSQDARANDGQTQDAEPTEPIGDPVVTPPDIANDRNEVTFEAKHRHCDYHAHDDLTLNEWEDGYYVCHANSDPAYTIRALLIGDIVHIDGMNCEVTSVLDTEAGRAFEDIRNMLGWNVVIFHTASGDGSGRIRLVACRPDNAHEFGVWNNGQLYSRYDWLNR